jgi:hypothetical protein
VSVPKHLGGAVVPRSVPNPLEPRANTIGVRAMRVAVTSLVEVEWYVPLRWVTLVTGPALEVGPFFAIDGCSRSARFDWHQKTERT